MSKVMWAGGAGAILLVMSGGCAELPTAPGGGPEPAANVTAEEFAAARSRAAAAERGGMPGLQGMLMRALRRVASERGRDAAGALAEPVRARQAEARQARAAGDRDGYRAANEAARAAAAGVIVSVAGTAPVEQLLAQRDRAIARLEQAAPSNSRAAERSARMLEALRQSQSDARAALARGDAAGALLIATAGPFLPGRFVAPDRAGATPGGLRGDANRARPWLRTGPERVAPPARMRSGEPPSGDRPWPRAQGGRVPGSR